MSKINMEDCNKYINNKFDLVLVASQRGKELNHGAAPLTSDSKGKEAIIALKEIASGKLNIENLEKAIIKKTFIGKKEIIGIDEQTKKEGLDHYETKHIRKSSKTPHPGLEGNIFEDETIIKE